METPFDCIVAGLGAAGSACLYQLAARGVRVAGFDAHTPPHAHGSSHGETRMIREAYFEDPCYVPLVRRAHELWHSLAAETGMTLIEETGGVFAGRPDGQLLPGMRRAGRDHGIGLEEVAVKDAARRFPWLHIDADMQAIIEARAGLLYPEACIRAHLEAAASRRATVRTGEPMVAWKTDGGGIEVRTPKARYRARRLVLAMGAWMVDPLASAGVAAAVARQPLFWFSPQNPSSVSSMPVYAVEFDTGRLLYGFPDRGLGLKVAVHDPGTPATPETIDRKVHDAEVAAIRSLTNRYLPGMMGRLRETATCMYTNAPDGHFIIDTHPAHPNVLLVSACSGHGFKFASAVGEAAAQWMTDGAPQLDLSPFSLQRFRTP